MNIFTFIKGLTPDELKVIEPVFVQKKKYLPSPEKEFFQLVLNSPPEELNDESVFQKLGRWDNMGAYYKVKSRVFYKILERMSGEEFAGNDEILDPFDRAEVRVKKKLYQAKVLWVKRSKTNNETFFHVLDEIIEEAREYELYDSLVEALKYKYFLVANRLGYKEYLKLKEDVSFYSQCATALREANEYYFEIISNKELIRNFSENEMKEFIDGKVQMLERSPYTTLSTRIQYFYKYIKLAQFQHQKKNRETVDICLEIISLLKRSKAVGRKERFGMVYGNMCQCLIYLREFRRAAKTAREAESYFPHESLNYIATLEQEFIACFYEKNYVRCNEVLDLMTSLNKNDSGQIRLDKYTYYRGCLNFVEGKFKDAKKVSNLALQIIKDKSRWDLGIRYLKIMSLVELGDFEDAREALEALRKQMSRNSADGKMKCSKRDELIYKAFNEYGLCGFQKDTTPHLVYLIDKLSKKEIDISWQFFTHEIIPVHRWLKKRIRKSSRKLPAKGLLIGAAN